MPNPKDPKQPGKPPVRRDRGPETESEHERERELEDWVGRKEGAEPELVPPGTEPGTVSREEGVGRTGGVMNEMEREAVAADSDNARNSDRDDARDGVDSSDTLPRDPDAAGGKS